MENELEAVLAEDSPRPSCNQKIESLRRLVICPICLDCMQHPTMLPCQHTFCQTCLLKTVVRNTVRCPQCRSVVPLPSERINSLPINIHIQSIIDVLGSPDSVSCIDCKKEVPKAIKCGHCNQRYCGECIKKHVTELKEEMTKTSEELENNCPQISASLKKFEDECKSIQERIHNVIENKITVLKDTEEALGKEIKEQLLLEEELSSRTSSKITSLVEKTKNIDWGQETRELIKQFLTYSQEIRDLSAEIITLNRRKKATFEPRTLTLEWKEWDNEDPRPIEANGKHLLEVHSRFYFTKQFHLKCRLSSGMLQRPSGAAVSPWSTEFFVVSMDTHLVHVFDVHSGRPVRSFGRRGHKDGEFLCPFGIALCPVQHRIYVTDKWKHCIHVFDAHGEFLRQIGSKGRSSCHFRSPESICVDGKGNIYICDTCNDRIQVLNPDGSFHHQIGVHVKNEGGRIRQNSMFQDPTGIAVTRDGTKVVVSDFGHHRIHVFSSNGDHLLTFGQKGSHRGQFLHPECVAVDNRGFILVGDSGNGRVQICRPDGSYVRTLGCKDFEERFNWVSGIAVTDDYGIVVCDFKSHCVQMYS